MIATKFHPEDWRGKSVGILGGSFNPAHEGHRYISEQALLHLGLDCVWWLVSPQNPLKSSDEMGAFDHRFKAAKKVAASSNIYVTDLEKQIGTVLTYQSLSKIVNLCPETHFVWLMGADNLKSFHQWDHWHNIVATMPIAVLARSEYSEQALESDAAKIYAENRFKQEDFLKLATTLPPAWAFIDCRPVNVSATELRQEAGSATAAIDRVLYHK